MRITTIVFSLLLIATPAFAHPHWYYTYHQAEISDSREQVLESTFTSEFNSLPKCIQKVVDKKLRHVIIRSGYLDFPQNAISYGIGFTVIEIKPVWALFDDEEGKIFYQRPVKQAFMHEMGHFYDWYDGRISDLPDFRHAVASDFQLMSRRLAAQNNYLLKPSEAFAELFSAKFLGKEYFNQQEPFAVESFPSANLMLDKFICKDK